MVLSQVSSCNSASKVGCMSHYIRSFRFYQLVLHDSVKCTLLQNSDKQRNEKIFYLRRISACNAEKQRDSPSWGGALGGGHRGLGPTKILVGEGTMHLPPPNNWPVHSLVLAL